MFFSNFRLPDQLPLGAEPSVALGLDSRGPDTGSGGKILIKNRDILQIMTCAGIRLWNKCGEEAGNGLQDRLPGKVLQSYYAGILEMI